VQTPWPALTVMKRKEPPSASPPPLQQQKQQSIIKLDVWSRIGQHASIHRYSQSETSDTKDIDNSDNHDTDTTPRITVSSSGGGSSSNTSGRGSLSGWISCPLCGSYSQKKYAIGRGLANHLNDVHTPWKPSKMAQKIHRREFERNERRRQIGHRKTVANDKNDDGHHRQNQHKKSNYNFKPLVEWEPSETDRSKWNKQMIEILEAAENGRTELTTTTTPSSAKKNDSKNKVLTYHDSLPPFLSAAANGDLETLKKLVAVANTNNCDGNALQQLLNTRDRHKSTAEHWAAGGGHLQCLMYLYELRRQALTVDNQSSTTTTTTTEVSENSSTSTSATERVRARRLKRRDGKTPLHYAARNGHIECIRYILHGIDDSTTLHNNSPSVPDVGKELVRSNTMNVNERSGEGTTALHLACYGGHFLTVQYLIEEEYANPFSLNDWGCSCAHWVAMSINDNEEEVRRICTYLRCLGRCRLDNESTTCTLTSSVISFVATQGQGHTPLHKAAHRLNKHVIRWLADDVESGGAGLSDEEKKQAGKPDDGGHRPSDIWKAMGGDSSFASWMESTMGW
jgi:ankyrin repeat protein